jgi:hypothetical protein
LDLLFKHTRIIVNVGVGVEVIRLMQRLVDFPAFKEARLFECLKLLEFFLSFDDCGLRRSAYRAFSLLYDQSYAIDFVSIQRDLADPELSSSVISLLLKIPDIPIVREIVLPLAKLARSADRHSASKLLFTLLDSKSAATILMDDPGFWRHGIPTFSDTLFAVLKIAEFQSDALVELPALPVLFALAADERAEGVFAGFYSILRKISFPQSFLDRLEEAEFFLPFFNALLECRDAEALVRGLKTVGLLATIGYCDSLRPFVKCLGRFVRDEDGAVARAALFGLHRMSFSRRLARVMCEQRINEHVKSFFGTEHEDPARQIVRNMRQIR